MHDLEVPEQHSLGALSWNILGSTLFIKISSKIKENEIHAKTDNEVLRVNL